jgi:hypothetical protein
MSTSQFDSHTELPLREWEIALSGAAHDLELTRLFVRGQHLGYVTLSREKDGKSHLRVVLFAEHRTTETEKILFENPTSASMVIAGIRRSLFGEFEDWPDHGIELLHRTQFISHLA